ncbi:MAG: diacylglycerol kinase family lipid kinase, partial [Armatimonadetes bacterium]|nr:diacylglycerol kinase family lipid kinase [Armatimonadota bacterium]
MMTDKPDGVLIVNPTAGRGRAGKEVGNIRRLLGGPGKNWAWHWTRATGDAERMAREAAQAGVPLVVAVGGDGTVYEVANGILATESTLGLIPFGTGNDLARTLGLFNDLELACRTLTEGRTLRLDVGVMEGRGTDGPRRFLVAAGTGYVADVAKTVNQGIRFVSGPAAYVWGAVTTLREFTPFHLTLDVDGETTEADAMFLAIANAPVTGGGMKLAPAARVDDGMLEVCLVGAVSKPTLLYELTRVFQGTHVNNPAVT